MKRWLLVLMFVTACSSSGSHPAASTSPSSGRATQQSSPSPSRSNVIAIISGPKKSTISLVGSDGAILATAQVDLAPFQPHMLMSWTSASLTRLYYLNGGNEVRFLTPGGSGGTATKITLGANEQAGFSVSPDDTRIAVAVFTYAAQGSAIPTYGGMRLYVEDLQGGSNHLEIFSSPTVAEFPVGWTAGRLVLAVGAPLCCNALTANPYAATSYHVVDPATATRLFSLCDGTAGPEGPVEPVGVICSGGPPRFQHWDGSPFPAPAAVPDPSQYLNALSPDGTRVAAGNVPIRIWGPSGRYEVLSESGYVFGWLDADHIVFQRLNSSTFSALDLKTRTSANLIAVGAYLGTFPAALS